MQKASKTSENILIYINLLLILQAGASFGSCKNVSVPSTSPVTTATGSFSGSVQFARSASTIHSPIFVVLYLCSLPLIAFIFRMQ